MKSFVLGFFLLAAMVAAGQAQALIIPPTGPSLPASFVNSNPPGAYPVPDATWGPPAPHCFQKYNISGRNEDNCWIWWRVQAGVAVSANYPGLSVNAAAKACFQPTNTTPQPQPPGAPPSICDALSQACDTMANEYMAQHQGLQNVHKPDMLYWGAFMDCNYYAGTATVIPQDPRVQEEKGPPNFGFPG